MKKHSLSYHILLILLLWSILPFMGGGSIMAQKFVSTRFKVVAGNKEDKTKKLQDWPFYYWFFVDMHQWTNDDYVYLGRMYNQKGRSWDNQNRLYELPLSNSMITDIIVKHTEESDLKNVAHTFWLNGKKYELIEYDQVDDEYKDRYGNPYRGSLRGRYCSDGHKHIYISHTGSNDYRNDRILQNVSLYTEYVNGAIGGCNLNSSSVKERYLLPHWHTHVKIFHIPNDRQHRVTCNGCYLDTLEYHRYRKFNGVDVGTMYPRYEANGKPSQLATEYHYKTCTICGFKLKVKHEFYNPTASESGHAEICKYCGYTKQASHRDYGKVKMPVNDSIHAMSCSDCAYFGYRPHNFGEPISVQWQRCDEGVASFKCIECDYIAYRKIEGLGHDLTDQGVCRRPGCIYRYQTAEKDSTGTYHIRNVGNLYWFAQAVNQGETDINAVLDNDIECDGQSDPEWTPIGNTPSHAYNGTFDAANHVITGLTTHSMTNQDRTKGIFGYVGTKGTVKNLVISSVQINGWSDLGIIAGRNDGTITGCTITSGLVTAGMTGAYMGGICGINNGTVKDCRVSEHVWLGTPSHVAGGICGNNSGSISAVSSKAINAQEDTNPLPQIGNDNNDNQ